MASQSSGLPAHRTWIQQARLQNDDAERRAAADQLRESTESSILVTDSFPGYDLEREIHRGAQGIVFRALQKSTGRRVAIKLLHEHAFASPLERARFEREMHVLAAIKHPNVVTIHDGGAHDGRVFLVMDYIAGHSLDIHMSGRPHSIRETIELLIPICDAVNEAHVRGIIHRDLKPANIRVDANGKPYVLDFGLAKLAPETGDLEGAAAIAPTVTGQFLGSLPWAAPEQAEGSPSRVDTRTDVYALGVLLFQMLTGKFPYPVTGPMKKVLESVISQIPRSPRSFRREIDDELETIVLKCLNKERERRYQSAGALSSDLRRYLGGEPIEAKRESSWYVLKKTAIRHKVALAVVSTFVVLLFASSVLAWVLSARANRAATNARRAEAEASEARREATQNLHASLIAEARATRHSGQMGQRFEPLDALRRAANIDPSLEVRNEVIAALAMPDVKLVNQIHRSQSGGYFDPDLERCAILESDNSMTLIHVKDETEVARIPPPVDGVRELHAFELHGGFFSRIYDPITGSRHLEIWKVPEARKILDVSDVPYRALHDFSPNGHRLAVGRMDRAIHIYDLDSGNEIQQVPLDRDPSYLAYDPSGRRLVLFHANYQRAQLLDLDSGTTVPIFDSNNTEWSVAWHPDGRLVAGASGSTIEIWDTVRRRRVTLLAEHENHVVHLMFSNDGTMLLSADWDGLAILWDTTCFRPMLRWNMAKPRFSEDDRFISGYTAASGLVIMQIERDTIRRKLYTNEEIEERSNADGAWIPGTGLVATVDRDFQEHTALLIQDSRSGKEVARQHLDGGRRIVLDPRGRFLLTAQEGGVFHWPIRTLQNSLLIGPPAARSNVSADAMGLSANGERMVFGDLSSGNFMVTDVSDARDHCSIACGRRASSVQLSPDGRWVSIGMWWAASGEASNASCEIWDADSCKLATRLPLSGISYSAFSPDGRFLTTNDSQSICTWETDTWRMVRQTSPAYHVLHYSPNGKLIAVAPGDSTIKVLDAETHDEVMTLEPPERFVTTNCAFTADGAWLTQFTTRKGIAHVWNLVAIDASLADMHLNIAENIIPTQSAPFGATPSVTLLPPPLQSSN